MLIFWANGTGEKELGISEFYPGKINPIALGCCENNDGTMGTSLRIFGWIFTGEKNGVNQLDGLVKPLVCNKKMGIHTPISKNSLMN